MTRASDVSVIVQGPIVRAAADPESDFLTRDVILSVRKYLPEAQIIVSTWEGANVAGLAADEVVFSTDPGAIAPNPDHPTRLNNVNRQLVSTSRGLAKADRPYTLKLRTDSPLTGAGFLEIDQVSAPRLRNWRLFRERILVPVQGSLHPAVVPCLYHVSDLCQFGLTADLRELWSGPLAPEPETSQAFTSFAPPPLVLNPVEGACVRMAPEQYYHVTYLGRRGVPAWVSYTAECRMRQTARALSYMANNFTFGDQREIGVKLPARITESSWCRIAGDVRPWLRTAHRLSGYWRRLGYLPLELLLVRAKWLHMWFRYHVRPRLANCALVRRAA